MLKDITEWSPDRSINYTTLASPAPQNLSWLVLSRSTTDYQHLKPESGES